MQNLGSRTTAGADRVRHREITGLDGQLSDLTMVPAPGGRADRVFPCGVAYLVRR